MRGPTFSTVAAVLVRVKHEHHEETWTFTFWDFYDIIPLVSPFPLFHCSFIA